MKKKFSMTLTLALVLTICSVFVFTPPQKATFSYTLLPSPDISQLEDYQNSLIDNSDDGDEIIDVTISLDTDSVLDTYLKQNPVETLNEFVLGSQGEKSQQLALDQIQKVEKELLGYEGVTLKSRACLIDSLIFASMPKKLSDEIEKLDNVKQVVPSPVLVIDDTHIQNELFSDEYLTSLATQEDGENDEEFLSKVGKNKIYNLENDGGKGGEGQLIGVIDTGLLYSHEAFSIMPDYETAKIKNSSYLSNAVKRKLKGGETASYYLNQKVVFKYDYAERDSNVTPGYNTESQHGTHVAGIIAGNNNDDFKGAAPNAQLAILKTFRNNSGESALDDLIAALEDSIIIGVDVINLSLGLAAGVPQDSIYNEITEKIIQAGISMVCSAGNENKSTTNNRTNSGLATTDNPDYGILSTPGAIKRAFCVASAGDKNNLFQISTYSSRGPGAELALKPEITAPGYEITSSVSSGNKNYLAMSGTSMASPNIAGTVAALRSYFKSETLNGYSLSERVYSLLMSTSYVLRDETNIPLSPRNQGAGLADPDRALSSPAYISGVNGTRAKLELGDDDLKTGKYAAEFEIHNTSDQAIVFDISQETVTEYARNGLCRNRSQLLQPSFALLGIRGNGTIQNETSVRVEKNSMISLKVEITLSQDDVDYITQTFSNGIYVEGFIFAKSQSASLHIPFLAYYGDWGASQTLDPFEGAEQKADYSPMTLFCRTGTSSSNIRLGAYSYAGDTGFSPEYSALSFNESGLVNFNSINNVTAKRAFKDLTVTITDFDTGEELYRSKSLKGPTPRQYTAPQGYNVNAIGTLSLDILNLNINRMGGENIFANNGKYVFNLLPTGFDDEEATPASTPFYIDSQAPSITAASNSDGKLELTLFDNHYIQAIQFYRKENGRDSYYPLRARFTKVDSPSVSSYSNISVDTQEFIPQLNESVDGLLYVFVTDYARNTSWYSFDLSKEGSAFSSVSRSYQASKNEYDKANDEQCFTDEFGVVYKKLPYGLKLVQYPNTLTLSSYKVAERTIRIERGAFENQTLETVVFPSSLKRIGDNAFSRCPSLKEAVFEGEVAPVIETGADGEYDAFPKKLILSDFSENYFWSGFFQSKPMMSIKEIENALQAYISDADMFEFAEYYAIKAAFDALSDDEKAKSGDVYSLLDSAKAFAELAKNYFDFKIALSSVI